MELFITAQGLVRAIYGEALPIHSLGAVRIHRASHVEPDDAGSWWADLEPSGGPVLGPFLLRSVALDAEHNWLTRHVLDPPHVPSPESPSLLHDQLPLPETAPPTPSPAEATLQTSAGRPDLL